MRAWPAGAPGPPPFPPAPRLGSRRGGEGFGSAPTTPLPVPVFLCWGSGLVPLRLLLFPSPSAEGERRAWNMPLYPRVAPCPEVKGEAPGRPRGTHRVAERSEELPEAGGEEKPGPCGKAKRWS